MKLLRLFGLVGLAGMWTHCDSGAEPGPSEPACELAPADTLVTVIDHALWTLAPSESDPWAEFRPESIECPPAARLQEDFAGIDSFGVETKSCNYTTVVQPLKTAICKGEQLYVWIWRFALSGPPGSKSHIVVAIDTDVVWQAEVDIPAPSALIALPVALPRAYPAGTPIYFHVRNHGDNSYQLLDLARCVGTCSPQ